MTETKVCLSSPADNGEWRAIVAGFGGEEGVALAFRIHCGPLTPVPRSERFGKAQLVASAYDRESALRAGALKSVYEGSSDHICNAAIRKSSCSKRHLKISMAS